MDDRGASIGDPSSGSQPDAVEAELRTFLIADIRAYTRYTAEHGADAAAELAGRFAAIVREVVATHDGYLLELRGDEALVVFVLARKALRAALDLQQRFAVELSAGVGIGLDAGEAIPIEGGYRGSALNLAARLCAQAGPGETLASEAVIHLAAKVEGIGYADPRTYRLKGIDEPIRAVHVVPAALGSRRPIRYGTDRWIQRRLLLPLAGGVLGIAALATWQVLGRPTGTNGPLISEPPSATPTARPTQNAIRLLPRIASALNPGIYRTEQFRPVLLLTIGSGWRTSGDLPDVVGLGPVGEGGVSEVVFVRIQAVFDDDCPAVARVVSSSPQELISTLQARSDLSVSDPIPVTSGGQPGLQVDITTLTDACEADGPGSLLFPVASGERRGGIGETTRLVVLDVAGKAIAADVYGPDLERTWTFVEPLLRTLRFEGVS